MKRKGQRRAAGMGAGAEGFTGPVNEDNEGKTGVTGLKYCRQSGRCDEKQKSGAVALGRTKGFSFKNGTLLYNNGDE